MIVDFPIEKIAIKIKCKGTSSIKLVLNEKRFDLEDYFISSADDIKKINHLTLEHYKQNPADKNSYAELEFFKINDHNFTEDLKQAHFLVNKSNHNNAPESLPNNGYFGYTGKVNISLEQTSDKLRRAAWLLADEHFETLKENVRGYNPREKTLETITQDAETMFNGCVAPVINEIDEFIGDIKIKDVKNYINFKEARTEIENWIAQSSRLRLKNLDSFKHFTYGAGNVHFLESFLNRTDTVYLADKYYYYLGEVTRHKQVKFKNFFDGIEENSKVLVEFPNPWHSNEDMMEIVKEARNKNCYVAVDLIWCPIASRKIDLDLSLFDEVYFSMNKAWPLQHIRPAWRWSKEKIYDSSTFQHEWNYVQKPQPNIFLKCIKKFSLDHAFEYWHESCDKIRNIFDLDETEVLWFTKKENFNYEQFKEHTSEHYSIGDFVCIRKLLDHRNEYFW